MQWTFRKVGQSNVRVEINPELLSWARERAGYDLNALAHRFPEARRLGTRHGAADAQTDRKVRASLIANRSVVDLS